MIQVLIVGVGGFLGASLRYMISFSTARYFGSFPVGTLIVNVVGGFLMGFIMESSNIWPISPNTRIFLTTGILGGLTTFSTFSFETISYLSKGEYLMSGFNACLNLFLALFACWAGKAVCLMISSRCS